MREERSVKPSVIDYNDYVDFLNDFVHYKKEMNKGWSYNVWARQLGITDPSLLRKVVKGSRTPNQEMSYKLAKYFEFSKEEADFFSVLIELRKTKIADDKKEQILQGFKNSILRKQYKAPERNLIPQQTTWKHSALYAFATLKQGMSLDLIKQSCTLNMSDEELLETIHDLIELGLLEFDEQGRVVTAEDADAYVIKREQASDSEEGLRLQQQAKLSYVKALEQNLFAEDGKTHLSMNVIARIPKEQLNTFKSEIKKTLLEVLFKYDQMPTNGDFELFNVYLGGYPAFKVENREKKTVKLPEVTM